jgi:hypothetical protein
MRSLPAVLILSLFAINGQIAAVDSTSLFNGSDLRDWEPHMRTNDAATSVPAWRVENEVIKCSGAPIGYLRTKARYRDYQLTVEWRWTGPAFPDAKGNPRNRNSGVLLHIQSPDVVWPQSIEAQLMESKAGELYLIGEISQATLATINAKAVLDAGGDEEAKKRASSNRRFSRVRASTERPIGEWNTYEIECRGDVIALKVNGVEQNRISGAPLQEGYIGLQSEGAPIEFRNVLLKALE